MATHVANRTPTSQRMAVQILPPPSSLLYFLPRERQESTATLLIHLFTRVNLTLPSRERTMVPKYISGVKWWK